MFAEGSGVLDQRRQKLGGLKSILFPSEHGTYKPSWFSYYSVRQKDVEMYRTSSAQAPSARHPPSSVILADLLMPTIGDCMRKTSFFQGSIPSRFRSFSCKTTLIHGDCPALNQHQNMPGRNPFTSFPDGFRIPYGLLVLLVLVGPSQEDFQQHRPAALDVTHAIGWKIADIDRQMIQV